MVCRQRSLFFTEGGYRLASRLLLGEQSSSLCKHLCYVCLPLETMTISFVFCSKVSRHHVELTLLSSPSLHSLLILFWVSYYQCSCKGIVSSQVEFLWSRRLCLYLVSQLKLVTCILPAFFFFSLTYRNSMRADSISTSNIKNRIGNKLLPEKFADVRHLLDEKRQHSCPRPAVGSSTKPGTVLLSSRSLVLLVSPPGQPGLDTKLL